MGGVPMRDRPLPTHSTDSLPTSEVAATLTLKQAALVANVSLRTLHRWLARGIVPGVVRQGRIIRIYKQSFDRWLQSGAK
jgi:excisionase family DNA binding protein